jgi:hypothetical protein
MYIKNMRNSSENKAFGTYKTLYLTGSLVLRNRLLFIYINVMCKLKNDEQNRI